MGNCYCGVTSVKGVKNGVEAQEDQQCTALLHEITSPYFTRSVPMNTFSYDRNVTSIRRLSTMRECNDTTVKRVMEMTDALD